MKIEVFAVCLTPDETVDSEDNIKKVKERLRTSDDISITTFCKQCH